MLFIRLFRKRKKKLLSFVVLCVFLYFSVYKILLRFAIIQFGKVPGGEINSNFDAGIRSVDGEKATLKTNSFNMELHKRKVDELEKLRELKDKFRQRREMFGNASKTLDESSLNRRKASFKDLLDRKPYRNSNLGHNYKRPAHIPFTYDKHYQGPIIEGWPVGSNRHLPDYVRPEIDDFLVKPTNVLEPSSRLDLLVVVHTAPKYIEGRTGVRRTWGSKKNQIANNMTVIFLVGQDEFGGAARTKILSSENEVYGDILQADFIDSYNNLTLKTLHTLKYLLKTDWPRGPPSYLFKTDDDAYFNAPGLWKYLKNRPKHKKSAAAEPFLSSILGFGGRKNKNPDKFILGRAFGQDNRPIYPIRIPRRKRKVLKFAKKWWCPTYMFNGREYPVMVSGSGYLVSHDAVDCLFNEVLKLPFFHLEDVLITGFGAQNCKIPIEHSDLIRSSGSRIEEVSSEDILAHYANARAKVRIHKMLLFDELQDKLNGALGINEFTLPPNDFFSADDDARHGNYPQGDLGAEERAKEEAKDELSPAAAVNRI